MLLNNYAATLRELGRLDQAADYAERAYTKAQQAGHQTVISQSLYERAKIYRYQHDFTRVQAMLSELEPRLRRSFPAGHFWFGLVASEKSLMAQAQGDLLGALRLADQAVALVETAVRNSQQGSGSLPTLLDRRSTIELEVGRTAEAVSDASRALRQLQTDAQPGTFSSFLGRGYLALGYALQAQGKPQEAHLQFRSAVDQLQNALGPDHPDTRSARQLAAQ